jgi:hypothetical protein
MFGGTMRRSRCLQLIFIIIGLTFLTGCPYLSSIPLNWPENATLDTTIIGTWQKPAGEVNPDELLHILQFNDKELLVLIWEEREVSVFRAFSTPVKNQKFLNVCEIQPGYTANQEYIFAEYNVEGDQLEIRFVEDGLFRGRNFDNHKELYDFIEINLDNDSLFGDLEFFMRSQKTQLKR